MRVFRLLRFAGLIALVAGFGLAVRGWARPQEPRTAQAPGLRTRAVAATRSGRAENARAAKPPTSHPLEAAPHWLLSHRFILGGLTALIAVGACAAAIGLFLYWGGFDTSASKPHYKLVALAAHNTMIHSVKKRAADVQVPSEFTQEQVLAGAKLYEGHCIACHGGAGVSRAVWAATMTPTPPFVIDSARNWSKSDLYIILLQGVKMSAMPAWGEILPDAQLWDLVAFLDAMPALSPTDFKAMREKVRAEPTTAMGASGPAVSLSPLPLQNTQPFDRGITPDDTALPPGMPGKPKDDKTAANRGGGQGAQADGVAARAGAHAATVADR